jgi:hypothetical protein
MAYAAVTAIRSTVATALDNPTVWQVFSYPPASPLANSVIITWDDPMVTPNNNTRKSIDATAHLRLTLTTELYDNQAALANIETMMTGVFTKLSNANLVFNVVNISAPTVLGDDAGKMLSVEMSIETLASWSA